MKEIKEGVKAPAFCLIDTDGNRHCLKYYTGKWIVLYFYPKDNTSGCTKEATDFTEANGEFEKAGAMIIGISPDPPKSHKKFIEKHKLSILLLSDPEHKVLTKYGVWQRKKMYGREYMGVVRSTFLVSTDGKIIKIWRKVKVDGHVRDVLNIFKEKVPN